jgi:hypothetical protein
MTSAEMELYVKAIENSRAVFAVNIQNKSIFCDLLDKKDSIEDSNLSLLEKLIHKSFVQHFNSAEGRYVTGVSSTLSQCIDAIRSHLMVFVKKNIGGKEPTQTKSFRWLRKMCNPKQKVKDALIMLYCYVTTFSDEDGKIRPGTESHRNNALILIDAMVKKYEI